jgi:hypothetical protein
LHEADTGQIDERLAEAERAAAQAIADSETAAAALKLLDERRGALEADLQAATKAQLANAASDLRAQYEKALAAFNAAVNAVQGPLETMGIIESVLAEVSRRQAAIAGQQNWAGGSPDRSFYLRRALKDEGLCIVREHDRQTWTPQWLSLPQPTADQREFRQSFFSDAALD